MNIYISTTGNDVTGDGTQGNPYGTLRKAISVAVSLFEDSNIFISNGNYLTKPIKISNHNYKINFIAETNNQVNVVNAKSLPNNWELIVEDNQLLDPDSIYDPVENPYVWDLLEEDQKGNIYRIKISDFVDEDTTDGNQWKSRLIPGMGQRSRIEEINLPAEDIGEESIYRKIEADSGYSGLKIHNTTNDFSTYWLCRYPKIDRNDRGNNFFYNSPLETVKIDVGSTNLYLVKPDVPHKKMEVWKKFPFIGDNTALIQGLRHYYSYGVLIADFERDVGDGTLVKEHQDFNGYFSWGEFDDVFILDDKRQYDFKYGTNAGLSNISFQHTPIEGFHTEEPGGNVWNFRTETPKLSTRLNICPGYPYGLVIYNMISDCGPGEFFLDFENEYIYINLVDGDNLDDFVLSTEERPTIEVGNSKGLSFTGINFYGSRCALLRLFESQNITFDRCRFRFANSKIGAIIKCKDIKFNKCEFSDCSAGGLHIGLCFDFNDIYNPVNIDFLNCYFYRLDWQTVSNNSALMINSFNGVNVINCVFEDASAISIHTQDSSGSDATVAWPKFNLNVINCIFNHTNYWAYDSGCIYSGNGYQTNMNHNYINNYFTDYGCIQDYLSGYESAIYTDNGGGNGMNIIGNVCDSDLPSLGFANNKSPNHMRFLNNKFIGHNGGIKLEGFNMGPNNIDMGSYRIEIYTESIAALQYYSYQDLPIDWDNHGKLFSEEPKWLQKHPQIDEHIKRAYFPPLYGDALYVTGESSTKYWNPVYNPEDAIWGIDVNWSRNKYGGRYIANMGEGRFGFIALRPHYYGSYYRDEILYPFNSICYSYNIENGQSVNTKDINIIRSSNLLNTYKYIGNDFTYIKDGKAYGGSYSSNWTLFKKPYSQEIHNIRLFRYEDVDNTIQKLDGISHLEVLMLAAVKDNLFSIQIFNKDLTILCVGESIISDEEITRVNLASVGTVNDTYYAGTVDVVSTFSNTDNTYYLYFDIQTIDDDSKYSTITIDLNQSDGEKVPVWFKDVDDYLLAEKDRLIIAVPTDKDISNIDNYILSHFTSDLLAYWKLDEDEVVIEYNGDPKNYLVDQIDTSQNISLDLSDVLYQNWDNVVNEANGDPITYPNGLNDIYTTGANDNLFSSNVNKLKVYGRNIASYNFAMFKPNFNFDESDPKKDNIFAGGLGLSFYMKLKNLLGGAWDRIVLARLCNSGPYSVNNLAENFEFWFRLPPANEYPDDTFYELRTDLGNRFNFRLNGSDWSDFLQRLPFLNVDVNLNEIESIWQSGTDEEKIATLLRQDHQIEILGEDLGVGFVQESTYLPEVSYNTYTGSINLEKDDSGPLNINEDHDIHVVINVIDNSSPDEDWYTYTFEFYVNGSFISDLTVRTAGLVPGTTTGLQFGKEFSLNQTYDDGIKTYGDPNAYFEFSNYFVINRPFELSEIMILYDNVKSKQANIYRENNPEVKTSYWTNSSHSQTRWLKLDFNTTDSIQDIIDSHNLNNPGDTLTVMGDNSIVLSQNDIDRNQSLDKYFLADNGLSNNQLALKYGYVGWKPVDADPSLSDDELKYFMGGFYASPDLSNTSSNDNFILCMDNRYFSYSRFNNEDITYGSFGCYNKIIDCWTVFAINQPGHYLYDGLDSHFLYPNDVYGGWSPCNLISGGGKGTTYSNRSKILVKEENAPNFVSIGNRHYNSLGNPVKPGDAPYFSDIDVADMGFDKGGHEDSPYSYSRYDLGIVSMGINDIIRLNSNIEKDAVFTYSQPTLDNESSWDLSGWAGKKWILHDEKPLKDYCIKNIVLNSRLSPVEGFARRNMI